MSPATGRVLGAVVATICLASAAQGMRLGEPPAGEGGIYWTEWESIHRSNLDGSDVEDLVKSRLRVPYDLALDPAGGKIYWTEWYWDSRTGTIQRADLDGSNPEPLVTGLSTPLDLALDVAGGRIYWTEQGEESGAISRADLDGANIEVLVTGLKNPGDLALDLGGDRIYWTENDWDSQNGSIRRAALDGSNPEILLDELEHPTTSLSMWPEARSTGRKSSAQPSAVPTSTGETSKSCSRQAAPRTSPWTRRVAGSTGRSGERRRAVSAVPTSTAATSKCSGK